MKIHADHHREPKTIETRQHDKKTSRLLPPPPPAAICDALKIKSVTIDWLAGDGSDRCYYRIMTPELEQNYVLMQLSESDAKLLSANGYDWVHLCKLLQENNICVPQLKAEMRPFAALIIEDYGNEMLEGLAIESIKSGADIAALYKPALKVCDQFLKIETQQNQIWCQRAFDKERLDWELRFFAQKYLKGVLGISFSPGQKEAFIKECHTLATYLGEQASYFVHRDFHSRNIMVHEGSYAVIDFQDARLGPASYDLVSLLFDSYVPIPQQKRVAIVENQIQEWKNSRTITETDAESWPAVLLQRQLKAIGSFGYLTTEKGKGDYLKNVAPALATLDNELVFCEEWPFLSSELLDLMRNAQGTHHV